MFRMYTSMDWQEHEDKLAKFSYFIKQRIEALEHKKINNASILNELKGLLFIIEEIIHLEGDYKEEIKERIESLSKSIKLEITSQNYNTNLKFIYETLKEYEIRVRNDLFSKIFPEDIKEKGIYRIEPVFRSSKNKEQFYLELANGPLEALTSLMEEEGEFHLTDSKKDIINVSKCEYFWKDSKNKQNYRCKILKGPCALIFSVEKGDCPDLESLVKQDPTDFFEQIVSDTYSTTQA